MYNLVVQRGVRIMILQELSLVFASNEHESWATLIARYTLVRTETYPAAAQGKVSHTDVSGF